jgi:N-acetylmuramoyl-L-alanine amidase
MVPVDATLVKEWRSPSMTRTAEAASVGRVPGSPLTRAVIAVSLLVALAAPFAAGAPAEAPHPRIVSKPIAFTAMRKLEMQAYAKRHYGLDTWRLRNPKVIVEHVTASSTFASAFSTFAADVPDSELHELPGTCAHFVIDTDGTIYQLVALTVMCRHTVGLNWTAIGIEHVGLSDAQVLSNPRQMASSLALTAWLMSRYGIGIGDVIGHNESLTSRFHHELYPGWRCQTHADWNRADMGVYRAELTALARRDGVPIGVPARRVTPRC